jgi:hypothetical protein
VSITGSLLAFGLAYNYSNERYSNQNICDILRYTPDDKDDAGIKGLVISIFFT